MPISLLPMALVFVSNIFAVEPRENIQPELLDKKIEEVIHESRFSWRMPRQEEARDEAGKSFPIRFLRQILRTLRKWTSADIDWLDDLLRGNRDRLEKGARTDSPSRQLLQVSIYALVLLCIAAAAYLFWRSRRSKAAAAQSAVIAPVIDLTAAEVSPALLEEEGWLALAKEFLEKNDLPMALRAYFLAGLAFLGRKELVRTNQAKSNREYQLELARRTRSIPEVMPVFSRNVVIFERCWYGERAAGRESIDEFIANLERIRSIAQ